MADEGGDGERETGCVEHIYVHTRIHIEKMGIEERQTEKHIGR